MDISQMRYVIRGKSHFVVSLDETIEYNPKKDLEFLGRTFAHKLVASEGRYHTVQKTQSEIENEARARGATIIATPKDVGRRNDIRGYIFLYRKNGSTPNQAP